MKIEFKYVIRLTKDQSLTWSRYKKRGYEGQFVASFPGSAIYPVGARLPIYLHGGRKPVAYAQVLSFEVELLAGTETQTVLVFDNTREDDTREE